MRCGDFGWRTWLEWLHSLERVGTAARRNSNHANADRKRFASKQDVVLYDKGFDEVHEDATDKGRAEPPLYLIERRT
jgi:hypothetical protein